MAHLHLTKEMQNSKQQQQQQQQQQHHQNNNKSAVESDKNEKASNEDRANDGTPLSPLAMAFNDRPKVIIDLVIHQNFCTVL